ncbi:enoyl-[acyl-carrier-protein] reductase [NADH] 1, chloroplastic-like [Zingiber officinale]|uniref:enoyl-[acyl-carrier-protein] reductase [NADH] 1, chloroplastic-like n=1 Tax=Zingiber officinale TaxID=94328 RepID=UPI001C4B1649|nr:enoyl-[acyl-carrier-protein] reductase [NADH] 1, chloroplastic-like [Zingiber officinale]
MAPESGRFGTGIRSLWHRNPVAKVPESGRLPNTAAIALDLCRDPRRVHPMAYSVGGSRRPEAVDSGQMAGGRARTVDRSTDPINIKGKRAFIAGVVDDNGYGWAITKALAAAGVEILVGTWVLALNIFETSLRCDKFDNCIYILPNGSLMDIVKVYPLDDVCDTPDDVPEDVKTNKRYAGSSNWTVKEMAEAVTKDFGRIDILVHSLANGPKVTKPLLETSRRGYLATISASSYSFVSLLRHFLPIMNPGGALISLTYIASERAIPGYGGGMSSAKAALESDTKVLAFELHLLATKHQVPSRVLGRMPTN